MKKVRKYLYIGGILWILTGLAGCGTKKMETEQIQETSETTSLPQETQQESDDWKSGELTINGVTATMPFDYSMAKDMGLSYNAWKYVNISEEYVVQPESEIDDYGVEFRDDKTGNDCMLYIGNPQDNICTCRNTKIFGIQMSLVNKNNKVDIYLPGGITWGATLEEIKNVYGEPNGSQYEKGEEYYEKEDKTTLNYFGAPQEAPFGELKMCLTVSGQDGLCELEYETVCEKSDGNDETEHIRCDGQREH